MVNEMEKLTEVLDHPKLEKEMFITFMRHAEDLVLQCMRIKWNFYKKYIHALKLDELNASMLRFLQTDVQLLTFRNIQDLQAEIGMQRRRIEGDSGRRSSGISSVNGNDIGFDDRVRDLRVMILKDSAKILLPCVEQIS